MFCQYARANSQLNRPGISTPPGRLPRGPVGAARKLLIVQAAFVNVFLASVRVAGVASAHTQTHTQRTAEEASLTHSPGLVRYPFRWLGAYTLRCLCVNAAGQFDNQRMGFRSGTSHGRSQMSVCERRWPDSTTNEWVSGAALHTAVARPPGRAKVTRTDNSQVSTIASCNCTSPKTRLQALCCLPLC